MIEVTRINDQRVVVNADLIKFVEAVPDTILTLTTGERIFVKESPEEVISRIVEFGRRLRIYPGA